MIASPFPSSVHAQLPLPSEKAGGGGLSPTVLAALIAAKVDPTRVPGPLSSTPPPTPEDLGRYVRDVDAARRLGKALFWDMQVGSDGSTACATCHWNAGADVRVRNALAPHGPGIAANSGFRGADIQLTAADFPLRKLADPLNARSAVLRDTVEVVGSAGVVRAAFGGILRKKPWERAIPVADPVFQVAGANVRQVTDRNAPTVVNAVFNDRQFWDGRASRYFNGVNPFGAADKSARIWSSDGSTARQVAVLIDNSSLASQAVGPLNNSIEMAWDGRTFPLVGRKMLSRPPLALQRVDRADSLLGTFASPTGLGLRPGLTYAKLIRQAFQPEWWQSRESVDGEFTQMEANFGLFWGLSLQLYQSMLVSDDAPFDRFMRGDAAALTARQLVGLRLFVNAGRCVNCHKGAEFAGGTVSAVRPEDSSQRSLIEFMTVGDKRRAFYDSGFYNIGVRPSAEDLGIGGEGPFGPFSYVRQRQQGATIDDPTAVPAGAATAVRGAFKTPTLRNISLTGPYFHNGGQATLKQVIEFYARGGDFARENAADLAPDIVVIKPLVRNPRKVEALEDFLRALTDPRVEFQRAPFDHPQLWLAHEGRPGAIDRSLGKRVELPATGSGGGASLREFARVLIDGQPTPVGDGP